MVLASDLAVFPVTFARAFGGDFISADLQAPARPGGDGEGARDAAPTCSRPARCRAATPPPRNDDQVTWLQQGRAAFTRAALRPLRPAQQPGPVERIPGKIKAIEFPVSATLHAGTGMASVVEFWAMAIPANSRDKDLAWSFIKAVSSKAVTLGAARNGNGPVRVSTYADPDFAAGAAAGRDRIGRRWPSARAAARPSPRRCARRRSSSRRCSSRCSAAKRRRRRSPRSRNASARCCRPDRGSGSACGRPRK